MAIDLAKALKHRIVLLSGEEEVVRRRALGDLLGASGADEFDVESVEAGAQPQQQWIGSACTSPFLSDRRVVVVRKLLREDPPTPLPELPESSLLLLVADDEIATDIDRQKRFDRVKKLWEVAVEKAGGLVHQGLVDPREARKELADAVKEWDKKLATTALDLLLEMTGGSMSRALEELEKAAIYAGAADTITETHVRAVTLASREYNVFRLVEGTLSGRRGEALRHLRTLMDSTNKPEELLFQRLFPEMSRQLRLLWQARICSEAGAQPSSAPPEIARLFASKPNLATQRDYAQRQYMKLARTVGFNQISECLRALADAEAEIKGLRPASGLTDTCERLVMRMADAAAPAMSR